MHFLDKAYFVARKMHFLDNFLWVWCRGRSRGPDAAKNRTKPFVPRQLCVLPAYARTPSRCPPLKKSEVVCYLLDFSDWIFLIVWDRHVQNRWLFIIFSVTVKLCSLVSEDVKNSVHIFSIQRTLMFFKNLASYIDIWILKIFLPSFSLAYIYIQILSLWLIP